MHPPQTPAAPFKRLYPAFAAPRLEIASPAGRSSLVSQWRTSITLPRCSSYCRVFVFFRTRSTTAVSSGAFGAIPLIRRSKKGALTFDSRRVQYGFISRYSTFLRQAAISHNHSLLMVVVIFGKSGTPDAAFLRAGLLVAFDNLPMLLGPFIPAFQWLDCVGGLSLVVSLCVDTLCRLLRPGSGIIFLFLHGAESTNEDVALNLRLSL